MSEHDNDFAIDQYALDVEWRRQPELYHRYATHLADARRDYERTKEMQVRLDADLMMDIRERPSAYGLDKVTEAAVAAALQAADKHQDAVDAVLTAKHKVDRLAADCATLDHKRKALENLVELHGMDYFSEPRVRTAAGAAGTDKVRKEAVQERIKRRRAERATASDDE